MLLFRLNRKDFKDWTDSISRAISDLESLIRGNIALESYRQTRSSGKAINILRDLSLSLHRALGSSSPCSCSSTHDISLSLSSKITDAIYGDEDEAIMNRTNFCVAISFKTTENPALESKKHWGEVSITPTTTPIQPASLGEPPVLHASKTRASSATATSQSHEILKGEAPAKITQRLEVTAAIVIETPSGAVNATISPPLSLCVALSGPRPTQSASYGQLVDFEGPKYCFNVFPKVSSIGTNPWSVITLHDVLKQKPGLKPLLWLEEKIRLAVAVAFSFLQLGKTPWLPGPLTKQELHFFNRDGCVTYRDLFLSTSLSLAESSGNSTRHTNALFALGILLLEIILGSSLEQLREPKEKTDIPGDHFGIIRDSITASRLLRDRVALINPEYKTVIERCISCAPGDLSEEGVREKVYSGVVWELERMLQFTMLA